MSFISKIFGAKRRNLANKKTEQDVQRQLKPLGDIGMAIVQGSQKCSQGMKQMFKVPEGLDKSSPQNYPEIWVFYEFLYFFMHMTMRLASRRLREGQIQQLQNFLGPLLSSTAVDSFCRHWPDERKAKLRSEFYTNLNAAEIEYSKAKEFISKDPSMSGEASCSILARNVAEASGNKMTPPVLIAVIRSVTDAYAEMNLDKLMIEAGKVL